MCKFEQTRTLLEKSRQYVKEIKDASDKKIVTVETLDGIEILLFRKIVILY